ncbi:MAG: caspase family protein [Bacteroidales bacterium]|nr:caspase family protein [Bacteroidales bacterium]MCF8403283.1 caspase family protein [Bacteroidales bacterium]
MKSIWTLLIALLITFAGFSQVISGKSLSKKVTFFKSQERSIITQLPDLIIQGERFTDENENNFIDAAENCSLNFTIGNIGEGIAENVKVKLSTKNGIINGLSFNPYVSLGDIAAHSSKNVVLPLEGKMELQDGMAEFFIEVLEDRGFDAFPLEIKIETKAFATPEVIVADAVFSTEDGGLIKLNYPINLKVIVQNIGQGDAKNVRADFNLPNPNCVFLGELNSYDLGLMKRGESHELEFLFTATRRYTLNEIPVLVDIKEALNKYAKDTTLYVGLEQRLTARNEVVISGIKTETPNIVRASLTSEVDKNIPVNMTKYPYRYALIIGNEDYSRFQRGLDNEANVEFARNDAKIFKEYAVKTLGVDDMNAHLLQDATAGEIYQKIDLVSKLASKTGEQAEIIFFYAGHGLPDEVDRAPYLIPVDVAGSNLNAAIKLEEVYKKFAESGAGKVSVFLDACFSGGGRDAGLIAARSVKVKPKKDLINGSLVVFSASTGEQSALPNETEQHGMFSFYLLKKLKESQGNVTYGELADYISTNVSIESLRINQKEQDPVINVSPLVEETWKEWTFN